ncbi:MAG: SAM-dependent methyltransferase [Maribacter sp.]|jgi:SAM-dependent methyltransferase
MIEKLLNRETYSSIFGKNDNHIGITAESDESFKDSQNRIVKKMCRYLNNIKGSSRILVIGSGFGNSVRQIAEVYKCHLDCINMEGYENEYLSLMVKESGLEKYIRILDASPNNIPFKSKHYDYIWCQDGLVFYKNLDRLFKSIHYSLKPEGKFICTIPLKGENRSCEFVDSINRGEIPNLYFKKKDEVNASAKKADLSRVISNTKPIALLNHLKQFRDIHLNNANKNDNIRNLRVTTDLWINATEMGCMDWGIFLFQKRNA